MTQEPKAKPESVTMTIIRRALGEADPVKAAERVNVLREQYPDATRDELVEALIRRKVQGTAAIGAATSGADVIPGIGTMVALTTGVVDLTATFRMQVELVLEIAAAQGCLLSSVEARNAVLIVTGVSLSSETLMKQAGRAVSKAAAERFTGRWLIKAIPVLGIPASAGINALTTYVIGRRASAYFARGPQALGSWSEDVRTITGLDERKVFGWLSDGAGKGWRVGTGLAGGAALGVLKGVGIAIGTVAGSAGAVSRAFRRKRRLAPNHQDPKKNGPEPN